MPSSKCSLVRLLTLGYLSLAGALAASPASAQLEFERPPIDYHERPSQDPVASLQTRIDSGDATLAWDEQHGYLPAVLSALGIDPASQMLVFSKTSFQLQRIRPETPRAVYFNDDAYVGWVQRGDVVEVSAVDPELGAVFYTLAQERVAQPQFLRDKGQCLTCHASSRTQGVPGHLVRSVFADERGQPQLGSGTFTIDHTSPFEKRWGGWYVTGTHGAMRHMGNVLSKSRTHPEDLDREAGANVTDLAPHLHVDPYLRPTSDIVALMVLEHQSQMHNFLTRASYEARHAAHLDGIMNEALDRDPDYQSESTQRRIASAGDKLLEYMLFSGEFALIAPVAGVSGFADHFARQGPRDSQGRSLRDFDLTTRLMKYPCSFLIYSPAFRTLPPTVHDYVVGRLEKVLSGEDQSAEFAHLTPEDRRAIREILDETAPDLFRSAVTTSAVTPK
ncbi:MAG: hypothetical protein KDA75_09570 [Planctomycetaceae bacterium]|nr:hypothetical protein [Planctomycetaceae bacterium]